MNNKMFRKAFTLLELSIVLIIIGIMAAGAAHWLKNLTLKERLIADRNVVGSAKDAIIDFSIKNKRLPTPSEFAALNIKSFANKDVFYNSDTPLQINLCDRVNTVLNITDHNNVTVNNIGFVVAVAGTNTKMQTNRVVNNITFPQQGTQIGNLEYDDSYVFLPLGELQAEIGCKPVEIVNPALYTGSTGVPYSADIIATGGKGLYAFALASNATGIVIDAVSGVITWANPVTGSYTLTVTVNSGDFPAVVKKFVLVINGTSQVIPSSPGPLIPPAPTPVVGGGGGNNQTTNPGVGSGQNNGNGWNGDGGNSAGGWN